jgi:hypothetical protein
MRLLKPLQDEPYICHTKAVAEPVIQLVLTGWPVRRSVSLTTSTM